MMITSQPTLIQFETTRKNQNIIPSTGSNSFYDIGNGVIDLYTIRNNSDDYRFDLFTNKGNIYTGAGNFIISGDISDVEYPYRNLNVISNTSLLVNQVMTITNDGMINVDGTLELMPYSQLLVRKHASVVFGAKSILVINDNSSLVVEREASLNIYGRIDIHISKVNSLMNSPNITIDSAAVWNVSGIEYIGRDFSFTDYESELREKLININTQGEKIVNNGRVGYIWRKGTPSESSYTIGLNTQYGSLPLGDFRLPILGIPINTYTNMHTISDLVINKNTTLYISEEYNSFKYIHPELYIGVIIGNTQNPANCIVKGSIICDGPNASITLDRGGTMTIEEDAEVHLYNNSTIRCTHCNDTPVLFINGALCIDDISQMKTFHSSNIVMGEHGKVIILNLERKERRLLFTTPIGIKNSDLYKIFFDKIEHVEYHVSKNTGIGIDQTFEDYSKEMIEWFGDRRFEQAIYDGIFIWHDGAYIELYDSITPWVDQDTTLLSLGKLFKCYGSYDKDRLQDVINRLIYAGCGDILFRFIYKNGTHEITLSLEQIHSTGLLHNPISKKYNLTTDNNGTLFIRNKINNSHPDNIIHKSAKKIMIDETEKVEFSL